MEFLNMESTAVEDVYVTTVTADRGEAATLAKIVESSFHKAFALTRDATHRFLEIDGMSGWRYREFINDLVRCVPNPRYLEIGSWKGSTLCAAISGNAIIATAIDNWSEFGGPRNEFYDNLESFQTDETKVTVLEADFRNVNYSTLNKHNIYLFDGPHAERDQYDGLALVAPALERKFVLIVDDWNHPSVTAGTKAALQNLGWGVDFFIEIKTTLDGSHPSHFGKDSEWHNGYFIAAVCQNS